MPNIRVGVSALLCVVATAGTAYAQKGKPGPSPCGADVPLKVTVHQSPAGDDEYGYGPYLYVPDTGVTTTFIDGGKGSNKVSAIFQVENCSFDLTLNLNFTSRFLKAILPDVPGIDGTIQSDFFNFDRIGSVPITAPAGGGDPESPTMNPALAAYCAASVGQLQSPTPQDNYGGCGGRGTEADPFFVRRAAGGSLYEGPARDYRFRFRRSPLDGNYSDCSREPAICETSYVRVYHPTTSSWIITPDTDVRDLANQVISYDSARAAIVSLVDNNEAALAASVHFPFRITIEKK